MTQPVPRPIVIVASFLVTASAGCDGERPAARDIALLASRAVNDTVRATPMDTGGLCIPRHRPKVSVRGVVNREVRAGPPGYGETPALDRRDTILVLLLPKPVPVCTDRGLDRSGPAVIEADTIQLVGRLDPRAHHTGDTVTAFGALLQRTWGWQYTPVILEVDSIVRRDWTRSRAG